MRTDDADRFLLAWVDASNAGHWREVEALLHDDVVLHDPMAAEPAHGIRDVVDRVRAQYDPFPDGRLDVVAPAMTRGDDPTFAYGWRFCGTHDRPIRPPGFVATGRRVTLDGVSLITLDAGRARNVRLFFDATAVARQIGAAPPPGAPLERAVVLTQRLRTRLRR